MELAAAVKEPINVYFDKNRHDGLLETHQVSESLEHKLRCLIFIPIVSQTYCDPKSFAWQQEFVVFNRLAAQDDLGKNVRLLNGNVASRVIPVRIHDLDTVDVDLLEKELGPLRSIDFVYRTDGVSRPLLINELDPKANLNHTFYRDQLHKVVRSIKDIVSAVQAPSGISPKPTAQDPQQSTSTVVATSKRKFNWLQVGAATIVLAVAATWYLSGTTPAVGVNSIAVLPFDNLSNDPEQDPFCDGTTEQVISNLSRLPDLRVIARTSVLQYKNSNKTIAEIGRELNVTHVLESSVRKSGNRLRVTAQLIAVKDESHLWSEDYDNKNVEDIFQIQDDVAIRIAASLRKKLLPEEKEKMKSERTANIEAYEHYVRGEYIHGSLFWSTLQEKDFKAAESEFLQAISLDSTYATAVAGISNLYDSKANTSDPDSEEAKKYRALATSYARKAISLNPKLPYALIASFQSWARGVKSEGDIDSAYAYGSKAWEGAPTSGLINNELSLFFGQLGLVAIARQLSDRSIKLAPSAYRNIMRGFIEMQVGDIQEAKRYLEIAKKLDSSSQMVHYLSISLLLAEGKTDLAERALAAYTSSDSYVWLKYARAGLLAQQGKGKEALSYSRDWYTMATLQMPEAIEELEKVFREAAGGLHQETLKDRRLDYLRSTPRFKALEKKVNERYQQRLARLGTMVVPPL